MREEKTMRTQSPLSKMTKERLLDFLKQMGIIGDNFTGKISFNLNQGAICDVEKLERLK